MTRRPLQIPLRVDTAVVIAMAVVIVAALAVIGAIHAARDSTPTPPPTTYIVGPDGDAVEIAP